MRVNHVEKANKDQGSCGRCNTPLPKGCAYIWIKGRYTSRKVRCTESKCRFRQSDLTGSKLSQAYAAQETAEDFLSEWSSGDGIEGLQEACSEMAEQLREVAQEYRDSSDNIRETFSESTTADECEEKADNLESWADEVEDAGNGIDEFEVSFEDKVECPSCHGGEEGEESAEHKTEGQYTCKLCDHEFTIPEGEQKDGNGETREDWAEEARSAVQDAINNCPL